MVQKTKTVTILVGRGPGGGSRRLEMWWINASAPLFGTKLTRPKVRAECYAHSALNAILTIFIYIYIYTIQSNLSNTDTERTERSVRISIRIKEVTMITSLL